MRVRNSIFPPTKVSLFHNSSPKENIKPFEKRSYPGQKKSFFHFSFQKGSVYFITPGQKFSFFIFHYSSSASDQNENTRFCKIEWSECLVFNIQLLCDSLTGAETGWRRPNPYTVPTAKKKRRETKQKKIFQDLFFHCDDWTRKGVPECLSIPLSSPRVARLVSCMHVNSDGGQRRDWKLRKLTQWIKNINRLRMKVRSHLEKEAKHLLKPEEREELARKVYEIRSVN